MTQTSTERVTPAALAAFKHERRPFVMVTAYDFNTASVADAAGVDVVLVGDSAATTMLGYASTQLVSVEEMLMLTRAVRRGLTRPLLVGDLPYGTYESSNELALATARRFIDVGCAAVKLEGGTPERVDRARTLVAAGIPVMGHVGLTPQSTGVGGTYRVQGRTADQAMSVLDGANALESAGCFAIVFEAIPAAVTELLISRVRVPVIGIGAGHAADGQVLVFDDLIGLSLGKPPKFVKQYADARTQLVTAVEEFARDVRARSFPSAGHDYGIDAAELESLRTRLRMAN